MKQFAKRLLSLLIVAVMVCAMLPVTALAAYEITSVPLTLRISSYSAKFLNGSTGAHDVNPITWTKYIAKSDVGSDNAQGKAKAYFTKEGDSYWLTLDVEIGNYKETLWLSALVSKTQNIVLSSNSD